jgi:hypothetical protein
LPPRWLKHPYNPRKTLNSFIPQGLIETAKLAL